MPATLIGRKIGMTRLNVTRRKLYGKSKLKSYDVTLHPEQLEEIEAGQEESLEVTVTNDPVTLIEAGPCYISQIKTSKDDGYDAVQLGFEDVKARNSTMPLIGHDAVAGLSPKRVRREALLGDDQVGQYELGQPLTVELFEGVRFVDVMATSKGRGFAGGMKRWHFKGQPASHGTERKHRSPGSIGGHSSNAGTGKPKRGQHKAGQFGNKRITERSLQLVGVDKKRNLLMVKGPVPGPNQGLVIVREAVRLSKSKAKYAEVS